MMASKTEQQSWASRGRREEQPRAHHAEARSQWGSRRLTKRRASMKGGATELPRPTTAVAKKHKTLAMRIRSLLLYAFISLVFIAVSKQSARRRQHSTRFRAVGREGRLMDGGVQSQADHLLHELSGNNTADILGSAANAQGMDQRSNISAPSNNTDMIRNQDMSHGEPETETAAQQEILPSGILVHTSLDTRGMHPVCRIERACIMSNGMLSMPMWMAKHDLQLRRCGLGPHTFHTSPPDRADWRETDTDLALRLRLMQFKEPTSVMSDWLADHVLMSAYMFSVFRSDLQHSAPSARNCIIQPNATACQPLPALPEGVAMRPAIFAPPVVHSRPDSWEAGSAELLGSAFGDGQLHKLDVSEILRATDKGKTANLSGTCFRSVLVTETKLKDLPPLSFSAESAFFARSGVDRAATKILGGAGGCHVSIVGLESTGPPAMGLLEDLRLRVVELAREVLPGAALAFAIVRPDKQMPFREQMGAVGAADVVIGGSSQTLANMAFMRVNSTVFEVCPFAWEPTAYEELARSLGITHRRIVADPQTTHFKECLEHEVQQLRKQGRVQADETPEWVAQVENMWKTATAEFTLSGTTPLRLNEPGSGVSNFHTRSCARKQQTDFNVLEVARLVLREARDKCSLSS